MTEWREVVLDELCDRVTVGHVGKMADRYVDDGVPFLRSQNIKPFRISTEGMLHIDESFHAKLSKSELREGDVVIVRTGYPGTAAVIPPELDGSNCADLVIVTASADLNPHVLAGLLNSAWGRSTVSGHLVGSAQQHFNVGSAKSLRVRLPGRGTQDRIASVLCTLNELIENNRRRLEVLEEMVRTIYAEWFIHFRFPGHKDATFVNSDLGPVPDDWRLSTCGKELEFIGGGTPRKSERSYWEDGTVDWFTPTDLTKSRPRYPRGSSLQITEQGLAGSSAKLFPPGTVMMTSRATLGVLAISTGPAATNQGFISILPDERWPPNFIREFLDASANALASIATGATFKEITKGSFKSFPFLVPPASVLDCFREATHAQELTIARLEAATEHLATIRDLLLPKLVTGRIDVSDLDLDALVERAGL